jgi:hypothetical protein
MRIARVDIVVTFEKDEEIVLSAGAALKRICADNQGKIIPVNAPAESPPEIPRALVRLPDDVVLNVGLNRFQVSAKPPSHVENGLEASLRFASNRGVEMLQQLLATTKPYGWAGVVAQVQYPDSRTPIVSATEAVTPLFDRLLRVGRRGRPLASFQVQYGLHDDWLIRTYSLSGYETRRLVVSAAGTPRVSELPIEESGITLTLDVNNRNHVGQTDPAEDIRTLVSAMRDDAGRIPRELGLEEDV